MRLFILVLFIIISACSQQPKLKVDNNGYAGTYYDPVTGEILFKILQDSSGFKLKDISLDPYVFADDRFEKVTLPNKEGEESWGKFCRGDFSEIMEGALGGSDWKENVLWYIQVEKTFIMKVRKGYQSNEHIYSTNYVLINGSECFNRMRSRRNIEKL